MVKKFVVTRPNYDLITSYLHDFSKGIIKAIKATKDIHITNLEGHEATRVNLEKAINNEDPRLLFLNGHGDKRTVTGHKNEPILDEENVRLTKKRIVYALSCDSLEELGPKAVKNGAEAYIGYKASFMLVRDPTRTGSPNKDKNALPFRRACTTMINALIFGKSVETAIELTKKEYRNSIRSYGTSEDDPFGDAPLIRFALSWNLEFLDMCGNPKAAF